MKAKRILSSALVLMIGTGIGFFVGKSLNKTVDSMTTNPTEEVQTQQVHQEKITDKISLEDIFSGYYTGHGIWAPSVVLKFKNISNQDIIDLISVEVVFLDEDTQEQLSAETKYLTGSSLRLAAGNSKKLHFASNLGWEIIPFGKKVVAKIYVEKTFINTVDINEYEITSLGERFGERYIY